MESTKLRQLIRESIHEYIREIDEAGDRAALEAKMAKTQEAIELREKKANMEGLDEAYHDMLDKTKVGELKKEIKALGKTLEKYKKQLTKMDGRNEPKEKEMVDESPEVTAEIDLGENDPESGPQLEEEAMDIYEVLHMQKRAGILSEAEYNKKIEEAKKMTTTQKAKKEDIVKGMKKSKSFGKSKDEKSKMYATATKLATKKKAKSLKEEVQALFEDKLSQIETSIQQEYPEIIEDGEIETGTEEWLFLLQLAFKTYGLNIADEYDILKAINGKGPYAQQVKDLGYTPIRALEAALKNLGVDII